MGKLSGSICNRRNFLLGISVGSVALAGCSDSPKDSDGDGVIDSEDYAPQDPEVQYKSDLESTVTDARESTTTLTPTSSPQTQTPTPTPTPRSQDTDNQLQATGLGSTSGMVSEYSGTEVSIQITGKESVGLQRGKVLAAVSGYPNGELKTYGVGGVVTLPDSGTRTYTVQIDNGPVPRNERLLYQIYIMPEGENFDSVQSSDLHYVAPSDPFRITSENRIERDLPSHLPGETSTSSFERSNIEGSISLDWSGTTDGRSWNISFVIHKFAYSEMVNEPRGRDYDEYVAVAQNSGLAEDIASLVDSDFEESGFTNDSDKVAAVIDWVQSFPYVTDDVYEGYDEYPKFPVETLVEVGGDCEDTSILLASVLQSEPFYYDMVLIGPPGHMAAGIYSTDRQGRYYTYEGRDYYYIETTGSGWGIGDMPEDYVGSSATIYQV